MRGHRKIIDRVSCYLYMEDLKHLSLEVESHVILCIYRRYFQHAHHFVPIVGVGKRGEY